MRSNHFNNRKGKQNNTNGKLNHNGKKLSHLEETLNAAQREPYLKLIKGETGQRNRALRHLSPEELRIRFFESKDGGITLLHNRLVEPLASIIANHLTPSERKKIDAANLMLSAKRHDDGKLMIRSALLKSARKFTPKELDEIRRHPLYARKILEIEGLPEEVIQVAEQHHLPLAQQSQSTRIIAVADVIATMYSERYYERKSIPEIINELRGCSGKTLDASVVKAAIKALNDPKILRKLKEIFRKRA